MLDPGPAHVESELPSEQRHDLEHKQNIGELSEWLHSRLGATPCNARNVHKSCLNHVDY